MLMSFRIMKIPVLLNNYKDVVLNGNEVTLHGYQALILEL